MPKLYNIDPRLLTDFSIPENIYLLGRFWADGNLRHSEINLCAKEGDAEHMFPFFRQMGLQKFHKRQRIHQGQPFGVPSYTISVSRKRVADFLRELDYSEKSKASPTKVLNRIDPSLRHLFWRGFFDGDGSLYIGSHARCSPKLSFWGTIEQDWTALIELCEKLKVTYSLTRYERKGGKHCSSTLQIRRRADMLMFMDWIYQSYQTDKIGLVRKYETYKKLQVLVSGSVLKRRGLNPGICYLKAINRWRALINPTEAVGLDHIVGCGYHKTLEEALEARKNKMLSLGLKEAGARLPDCLYQSKDRE
jgi:hypothetical protein